MKASQVGREQDLRKRGLAPRKQAPAAAARVATASIEATLSLMPGSKGQQRMPTRSPAALSFLHSDNFIPDANVFPNLNLGHSLDDLVEIGESFSAGKKVRMFAGYAGWSPGQLEDEMKRKSWITYPASLDLVFETPPERLWQKILKAKGGWKNKLLSQMPENLSWN